MSSYYVFHSMAAVIVIPEITIRHRHKAASGSASSLCLSFQNLSPSPKSCVLGCWLVWNTSKTPWPYAGLVNGRQQQIIGRVEEREARHLSSASLFWVSVGWLCPSARMHGSCQVVLSTQLFLSVLITLFFFCPFRKSVAPPEMHCISWLLYPHLCM